MVMKITARFENIDAADRAAAKIKHRMGDRAGVINSLVNNLVESDEMSELDMLVVPFPPTNQMFGAAVLNDVDVGIEENLEADMRQEAALIVTAPSSNISEVSAIITGSGGYFCHIENLVGSE